MMKKTLTSSRPVLTSSQSLGACHVATMRYHLSAMVCGVDYASYTVIDDKNDVKKNKRVYIIVQKR
jgi:hypothetical protein